MEADVCYGLATVLNFIVLQQPIPENTLPCLILWNNSIENAKYIELRGLDYDDIFYLMQCIVEFIKIEKTLDKVYSKAIVIVAKLRIDHKEKTVVKSIINISDSNFHNSQVGTCNSELTIQDNNKESSNNIIDRKDMVHMQAKSDNKKIQDDNAKIMNQTNYNIENSSIFSSQIGTVSSQIRIERSFLSDDINQAIQKIKEIAELSEDNKKIIIELLNQIDDAVKSNNKDAQTEAKFTLKGILQGIGNTSVKVIDALSGLANLANFLGFQL